MRLSKRITACALAAVMSVSLMVGCAGSGTKPNPGSSSSSTSTSTSTKPDSGSNSNSGASSSSNANSNCNSNYTSNSSSSDATAEPTWAKSKSYKYGLILNGEKLELKTEWKTEEFGRLSAGSTHAHFTRNGNKSYYMGTSSGVPCELVVFDKTGYILNPYAKTCIEIPMATLENMTDDEALPYVFISNHLKNIIGTTKPASFKTGTGTITGPTVYNTEVFDRTISVGGIKMVGKTTCYYEGDALKWVEFVAGSHRALVRVDLITATPNETLLKLPDGYSVTKWEDWDKEE